MNIFDYIKEALPASVAVVCTLLVLWLAHRLLEKRALVEEGYRFRKQVTLLGLAMAGIIVVIVTLPVSGELRGQLLSFLGIVLSAAVALSATTLLGNALAGVMLRAIRGFRMGDFIRVEGNLGRVSERGLFHTEIQTADRELITLPNLFLVTHPVATIRSSGTIVSATVSLGYDVARTRVQDLLTEAAREVGLEEPFIQVLELGDYAVTYRVAGLLTDIKTLISTRSRLRMAAMDALHRGRIEIVSPDFRNTRALPPERRFIPEAQPHESVEKPASPESTVFDKADEAEKLEKLCERYKQLEETVERLATEVKESEPAEKEQLEHQLEEKKKARDDLAQAIEQRQGEDADND